MNLRESGDLRSQGEFPPSACFQSPLKASCLTPPLLSPQLPFTWVSKSVRAPGRRTWLESERRRAAGPCGGGAGSAGGSAQVWLSGPPLWPISALLHPRRGGGPRGV